MTYKVVVFITENYRVAKQPLILSDIARHDKMIRNSEAAAMPTENQIVLEIPTYI